MMLDLNALAQRAREAGSDPQRFVRDCFEAATSRTPGPGGSIPMPQMNLAGAPQFGGVAAVGPSAGGVMDRLGSAANAAQADADALLGAVRSALTGRLPAVDTGKPRPPTGGGATTLTQEAALRQLVDALRNVFGLGVRSATLAVLTQADETLNWFGNKAGAGLDAIARFVFRLGRVLLQVFATSQEIVATAIYQAAAAVQSALAAAIPAVIALLTSGLSSTDFTTRVSAVIGATRQVIEKAISWALMAGFSAADAARTGLDGLGGRVEDWAVRVCAGALATAGRVKAVDLARALHSVLGFGADKVVSAQRAAGIAVADIGDALIAEFGNDRNAIARALYAAQVGCGEIASWMRGKYNLGASDTAQLLKDLGAGWHDITVGLRAAGFSANEAAQALRDKLGLGRDQIATELAKASYAAQDVTQALASLFGDVASAASAAVRKFF